jgi:hypothetical protein
MDMNGRSTWHEGGTRTFFGEEGWSAVPNSVCVCHQRRAPACHRGCLTRSEIPDQKHITHGWCGSWHEVARPYE